MVSCNTIPLVIKKKQALDPRKDTLESQKHEAPERSLLQRKARVTVSEQQQSVREREREWEQGWEPTGKTHEGIIQGDGNVLYLGNRLH